MDDDQKRQVVFLFLISLAGMLFATFLLLQQEWIIGSLIVFCSIVGVNLFVFNRFVSPFDLLG
ncbi:MAG: hypothetical protein JXA08_05955 [Methanomicrobiaceae archaeon]|nr:hypothetical protein [Methanomicrobiaceae archaeon]